MTHPTTRFPVPVSTSRPRGSRRIDVYSPKLQRRLQCFGETSYRQCLFLEADPSVRVYCERPAFLEIGNERRLADFWVKYADREWFLFVGNSPCPSMARIESREYEVRAVPPAELAAAWIWIENWERILPVVTSCQGLVTAPLLDTVRRFVCSPTPLTRIEQEFATADPTLVRAATFTLLHGGHLSAPSLWTEPLSLLTCFEPVEGRP